MSSPQRAGKCEGDAKTGGSCEGYEPVLNSRGKDVVIGTAVFEGYLAGESCLFMPPLHCASNSPAAAIVGYVWPRHRLELGRRLQETAHILTALILAHLQVLASLPRR